MFWPDVVYSKTIILKSWDLQSSYPTSRIRRLYLLIINWYIVYTWAGCTRLYKEAHLELHHMILSDLVFSMIYSYGTRRVIKHMTWNMNIFITIKVTPHTLRGEHIQEEWGYGRKSKTWKCLMSPLQRS
jgi:hypothetical protein